MSSNKLTGCSENISLLDSYYSEYIHRDNLQWSQTYRFFISGLILIFIPRMSDFFSLDIAFIPSLVFYSIGIVYSIVFVLFINANAARLKAIGDTIFTIIETLPKKYRRKRVEGKLTKMRTYKVISYTMAGALLIISITLLTYTIFA